MSATPAIRIFGTIRVASTQYTSEPEWPWERLRKESPGVYESYVDLEAGVFTRYKIVVKWTRAELYVHGRRSRA